MGGTRRAKQTIVLCEAEIVASQASTARQLAPFVRPALINGAAGAVIATGGVVLSVMGFVVVRGKIVAIDVLADPERLAKIDFAALDEAR